jgi:putative tricarboxylic transport membrane protein
MPQHLWRRDFLGGLLVVAVAAVAWWLAQPLASGGNGGVGPGTLPKALAAILGGLGVVLAANALMEQGPGLGRWTLRGPLLILGGIALFGLAVRPLGLSVAGPLLIIVGAFASLEVRWGETLVFGALMTLFCIGLFKLALGLPIPLAPWLVGY